MSKFLAAIAFGLSLIPGMGHTAELNPAPPSPAPPSPAPPNPAPPNPALLNPAPPSPAPLNVVPLNLATLSCDKYENEVLPAAATSTTADSINTVMWLFGYSVAKSGAHVLYPDALSPFGFALDGECKANPRESLLDALAIVKPETKNPMNLTTLECATFAGRHVELARTDPESANTIMMWLFGFSVARSGGHLFDAGGLGSFQKALLADCAKRPAISLFDALSAVRPAH